MCTFYLMLSAIHWSQHVKRGPKIGICSQMLLESADVSLESHSPHICPMVQGGTDKGELEATVLQKVDCVGEHMSVHLYVCSGTCSIKRM